MWPLTGKLLNGTLLWCCLFFNSTQFAISENLSILELALAGVKGFIILFLICGRCTAVYLMLETLLSASQNHVMFYSVLIVGIKQYLYNYKYCDGHIFHSKP